MGTVKYTGPVASFHCPTNADIRSLKVHFSPKQLGEGTPSPENVREIEGWDGVEVEYTKNNLAQFEPYGTDGINLKWSVPKSILDTSSLIRYSIYIDNSNGTSEARIRVAFFDINGNRLQSRTRASGTPVGQSKRDYFTIQPFPSGTDYVVFGIKGNNFNIKEPMIDIFQNNAFKETPYEPYQGSTTNYTFGVLGKNKFDKSQSVDGRIMKANGTNYTADSGYYISPFIPVVAGASYTKNSPVVDAYHRFATYSSDNVNSFIRVFDTSNTITIEPGENYIRFCGETSEIDTAQLELGSTATTYEPYNPNHTVYGGWVDLINGEVCEEWGKIKINSDIFMGKNIVSNSDMYVFNIYGLYGGQYDSGRAQPSILSTNYDVKPIRELAAENYPSNKISLSNSGNRICFFTTTNKYTTEEELITSMLNETVIIKLATPNTYHLAPTQLQTFLGQNNVWSNADYVEVEYDLHETQDILARKQFIIANQPHLEEVNNSMITFNTDLKAPLKECKVYFNPIQEGSGDPSPDNVRPIIGWTGLSLYHSEGNLYTPNSNNKGYISSSGVINVDTTSTYTDLIPVVVGDTYTFRCTTVSVNGKTNRRIHGYDSSGNWIKQLAVGTTSANIVEEKVITTTIPSGISYIRISFRNQDTNVRVAREDAYDISWENEVGTVYGGYVDLVTGEVWETWGGVTLDGSQNAYISGSQYRGTNCTDIWFDAGSDKWGYNTSYAEMLADSYCDSLALMPKAIWGNPDLYPWAYVLNSVNQIHCVFDNSTVGITSEDTNAQAITKVKSWLASHPITVKYRLSDSKATFVVTLSPITLKALRGINNIWSNSNGNIELSYWTH